MFDQTLHLRALLAEFESVCPSDIEYWLDAGTLLGHQRGGKFIPWDDDVDVGVLRGDFNRLVRELSQYSSSRFALHLPGSRNFIPINFDSIKIRDTWTSGYENGYSPDSVPEAYSGLALDIVPFDRSPIKPFFGLVVLFSKVHSKMRYKLYKHGAAKSKILRLMYVAYSFSFKVFLSVVPKTRAYLVPSWFGSYPRRRHLALDIFPLKAVVFEGVKVSTPRDPSPYLELLYGIDFMEPPTPENRKSHFEKITSKLS